MCSGCGPGFLVRVACRISVRIERVFAKVIGALELSAWISKGAYWKRGPGGGIPFVMSIAASTLVQAGYLDGTEFMVLA